MQYINIGDVTDQTLIDVQQAIANEDKEITLLIDSLGGNLQAGLGIFDAITTCPKDRHTFYARCTGNVASSATLILCAVPKENRTATVNTCFLIHQPLLNMYGTSNMGEIKQLANTMESANEQIKNIYRMRTNLDDELMDALMTSETEFYAPRAVEYGLIGQIEQLQNKRANYNRGVKHAKEIKHFKNMKKSFITMLTNKLVKALLNEAYTAEDGTELEISALEVGGTCSADGIFVVDGYTITSEGGVIIDIIAPADEQPEAPAEELENEGEGEEAPAVEEVAETVAEEVEQTVEEAEVTDATEIAEIVKEIVSEELSELEELKDLVDKCGGKEKLKALANVKHSNKVFASAPAKKENKSRSIAELMALKKK